MLPLDSPELSFVNTRVGAPARAGRSANSFLDSATRSPRTHTCRLSESSSSEPDSNPAGRRPVRASAAAGRSEAGVAAASTSATRRPRNSASTRAHSRLDRESAGITRKRDLAEPDYLAGELPRSTTGDSSTCSPLSGARTMRGPRSCAPASTSSTPRSAALTYTKPYSASWTASATCSPTHSGSSRRARLSAASGRRSSCIRRRPDPPGDRACQRRARDGAVFHNWIRTLPRRVIPLAGVVALHSRGQRGERLDLELILHQPDLIGSRRGSGRAGLHTSVHSCWNHSHFSRGRRAPLGASGQRAGSSSPLSSSSSGVVRV